MQFRKTLQVLLTVIVIINLLVYFNLQHKIQGLEISIIDKDNETKKLKETLSQEQAEGRRKEYEMGELKAAIIKKDADRVTMYNEILQHRNGNEVMDRGKLGLLKFFYGVKSPKITRKQKLKRQKPNVVHLSIVAGIVNWDRIEAAENTWISTLKDKSKVDIVSDQCGKTSIRCKEYRCKCDTNAIAELYQGGYTQAQLRFLYIFQQWMNLDTHSYANEWFAVVDDDVYVREGQLQESFKEWNLDASKPVIIAPNAQGNLRIPGSFVLISRAAIDIIAKDMIPFGRCHTLSMATTDIVHPFEVEAPSWDHVLSLCAGIHHIPVENTDRFLFEAYKIHKEQS